MSVRNTLVQKKEQSVMLTEGGRKDGGLESSTAPFIRSVPPGLPGIFTKDRGFVARLRWWPAADGQFTTAVPVCVACV